MTSLLMVMAVDNVDEDDKVVESGDCVNSGDCEKRSYLTSKKIRSAIDEEVDDYCFVMSSLQRRTPQSTLQWHRQ